MWVWSDELVERVAAAGVYVPAHVPLVAYAIGSEADIDELAVEVVAETKPDAADLPRVAGR